jgi:DNA (cytosine-5)-methyltransferase 1
MPTNTQKWNVVDLFSGAGGMSYGFYAHPSFKIVAAADAQIGKPSNGLGNLQCNSTYLKNVGIAPVNVDLADIRPELLSRALGIEGKTIDILLACPPCTGFSRTNPNNHLRDDPRNSLVRKSAEFAKALDVKIVIVENARELIQGNFAHHYQWFRDYLTQGNKYNVNGKIFYLNKFGLPQIRERAIIVATKKGLPTKNLEELWEGYSLKAETTSVKRALSLVQDERSSGHVFPKFKSKQVLDRIRAIPKNGGSWLDLAKDQNKSHLLTGSMKRLFKKGDTGSWPDVYGRMALEKPAPTIKRECGHVGNGRYAHPIEDRLCSVREMASLQGFPVNFEFNGASLSNLYRHIGDAVPPLISFQLACLCEWILTKKRPKIKSVLLPGTHLTPEDVEILEIGQLCPKHTK